MSQDYVIEILERIREDISEMKSTLAVNTHDLEQHMKRSQALEDQVELLKSEVLKLRGFASIAGWVIGVAATLLTVLDKLGKL